MKHICLTIWLWAAAESGGLQTTSSKNTHAYAVMIVHSDDGATSKIIGIQRLPNGGRISIFELNRRNNKNNHNTNNVPTLISLSPFYSP